jgi:6-phosphogluconolactonase
MPFAVGQSSKAKESYLVYVGTYTGPASKGIYAFRFNPASGRSSSLGLMAETTNPSFLAIDPTHHYLYAANEVGDYKGEKTGGVSAFAIDRKTGKLTFLNEVSSHGAGPCHVALDKSGKYVLVANYDGGSVAVFPVLPDGRLGKASAVVQHSGHGPDAERQEGPHAHEIQLTRDNRMAIAADLGLDELLVYRFDAAKGTLAANDPPFAKVEPGAGPRHFALHPNGKFLYSLNEMGGTVTGFAYDAPKCALRSLQTTSSLPKDFKGKNDSAEIVAAASGKFLYASNRGPDNIAVFAIDSATGTFKLVEHVPTKGKAPRNFAIDPTGKYLFAANQESNNIVVFRIDPKSGRLTDTGQVLEVPSPVCVVFMSAE